MRLNGTKAALAAAIGAIWAQPAAAAASLEPPPAAAATPAQPPRITTLRIDRGADSAVGYEVAFGRDGTPRTCRVTESSGSPEIDASVCADAVARPPFDPTSRTKVVYLPGPPGGTDTRLLNLREMFTADDYPKDALRAGVEGRVVAGLTVSPEGRAIGCRIVQSSGAVSLDSTTCRLIVERGRFNAAKPGWTETRTVLQPVRWTIPVQPPQELVDDGRQMRFALDSQGQLGQCRQTDLGKAKASLPCDDAEAAALIRAAIELIVAANRPPAGTMVLELGLLRGAAERAAAIGGGPGEVRYRLHLLSFTVLADGTIGSCVIPSNGFPPELIEMCSAKEPVFTPLAENAVDRSPRHANRYLAIYYSPAAEARQ